MQKKKCPKCGVTKPHSAYYAGYLDWCKACRRLQSNEYGKRNRDKKRAYWDANRAHLLEVQRQWRKENPEKAKAIWDRSHAKRRSARDAARALIPPPTDKQCYRCKLRKPFSEFNKGAHKKDGLATYCRDCSREKLRVQYAKNPKKAYLYVKKYTSSNRGRVNAYNRAAKIRRRHQAIVAWANKEEIQRFYAEANRLTRETGIKHAVDHIIPLKHPRVCGLHVETNLRVITKSENSKKRNSFHVE